MSGEHDVCPDCGAEAWCCSCVDLTDRCTTHHICPCLQAKLEVAEAENERLKAVLQPFAPWSLAIANVFADKPDDWEVMLLTVGQGKPRARLMMGDLRRAAAALEPKA